MSPFWRLEFFWWFLYFLKIYVPLSYGANAVKGSRQHDLSYAKQKTVGHASESPNVYLWFRQRFRRSVLY